jgi:hypothetical protein
MAKIILPLENYQKSGLEVLSEIFHPSDPLFISAIAIEDEEKIGARLIPVPALKEKIYSRQHSFSEINSPLEIFKEDALRMKIPFNISYTCSADFQLFLERNSLYSDFTLVTGFVPEMISYSEYKSSFLFSINDLRKVKEILVPVLNDSDLDLLKDFFRIFKYFLRNRNVIVMVERPENENEIQKEKFIVELLQGNLSYCSFGWFQSENYMKEIKTHLSLRDSYSMLLLHRARLHPLKEFLFSNHISFFTGKE